MNCHLIIGDLFNFKDKSWVWWMLLGLRKADLQMRCQACSVSFVGEDLDQTEVTGGSFSGLESW